MAISTDTRPRPIRAALEPPRLGGRAPAPQRLGPTTGLIAALAIVTVQVVVDFHIGAISDLKTLYFSHRLAHDPVPYVGVRIEYPVLIGLYVTAVASVTNGLHDYLLVSSVGLWLCAVVTTWALWNVSRRAAWSFALSPLLMVFSLLNWDLLAIALMALGWLAWTRNRYATAAALMTLGVFTKLYPVFLLCFCLAALVRRRHDGLAGTRDVARFAAAAALTAAIVNAPFAVLGFRNWSYFWTFNANRTEHADLLSWLGPLEHTPASSADHVLAVVMAITLVVGLRAIWRRASPAHVAAVAFFVYMLFQKVNSPQYTLWLLAYAAIDEWQPWTIAALSLMGIADYANAVIHIELVKQHAAGLNYWYVRHIYDRDEGLRLLTTLVTVVATVVRRDLRWRASPPPAPGLPA